MQTFENINKIDKPLVATGYWFVWGLFFAFRSYAFLTTGLLIDELIYKTEKKKQSYKTPNNGLAMAVEYLHGLQQARPGWRGWAERGRRRAVQMREKGVMKKNFTTENQCSLQKFE